MKKSTQRISASMTNIVFMLVGICLLNGCGIRGVNRVAPTYISHYTTFYDRSIACVGALLPQEKTYKYTSMVASFLDKTGKGSITTSKPITQGAADLAADSLAKFKFFKIKTAVPHNFRDNPQIFEFNKAGTDVFIHGSIVSLETTQDQRNLTFSLGDVNLSHKVTRVMAIVHMSLNSSLDNTVFINDRGELASGNFKAEWDVFENEFGLFRIIGGKGVNLQSQMKLSQVADQALHEAIERGMVELVGNMFSVPYGRCLPKRGNDFTEAEQIINERTSQKTGVAIAAPQQAPQAMQPAPRKKAAAKPQKQMAKKADPKTAEPKAVEKPQDSGEAVAPEASQETGKEPTTSEGKAKAVPQANPIPQAPAGNAKGNKSKADLIPQGDKMEKLTPLNSDMDGGLTPLGAEAAALSTIR